jgi:hypothetical protein
MNYIANARHAHNPKVEGSNPSPATNKLSTVTRILTVSPPIAEISGFPRFVAAKLPYKKRSLHSGGSSAHSGARLMTLILRLAFLLSLASVLSFAANWSGALVDAKCYATAQRNVSQGHPGSTDTKRTVRSCSPNEKTTEFSVVQQVGTTFNLDPDGNEKAHQLFLKHGRKSPFKVNVTGEATQDTLKVDTISIAK